MLKPETVSDTIKGWSVMFPGKKTTEELAYISAKFFKALSPIYSDKAFRVAAEIVESEQEFFPTIAHMRKKQNEVVDKIIRDRNQKPLPEPSQELSEEQRQKNLEKIAEIIALAKSYV